MGSRKIHNIHASPIAYAVWETYHAVVSTAGFLVLDICTVRAGHLVIGQYMGGVFLQLLEKLFRWTNRLTGQRA